MKISIITAVFNRASTLEQAILSVQAQSYTNTEHIFIDGLSNDGSIELIRRLKRPQDLLISEKDDGIYDALNKGILLATGDIIGIVHSDDYFSNNHVIRKIANQFCLNDIDGVYGDLDYISKHDDTKILRRWISGEYSQSKLKFGWMPPHPTLFLKREVFEKWGLYDKKLRISGDYEAILRYLSRGNIRLNYIPEVLVKMRVGGESNKSIKKIFQKSKEDLFAIRSNKTGGVSTLFFKNFRKLAQFL